MVSITEYPRHLHQPFSVPPIIEDCGAMRILADGFSVR